MLLFLIHLVQGQQFGSGCVQVTVSPSPGVALGTGAEWNFMLQFSAEVGYVSLTWHTNPLKKFPNISFSITSGLDVTPLAFWDSPSLLAFAATSPLLVRLLKKKL